MVAADDGSIAPPAAASRGGGVVLALSSSDRTRSGLVAVSAQMEPERFDVVSSSPVRLHRFDWEYFPGTTTREDETPRSPDVR